MKPGLRRIEATLSQLHAHETTLPDTTLSDRVAPSVQIAPSVEVGVVRWPSPPESSAPPPDRVPPFSAQPQPPTLPKSKPPALSSHRHSPNPSLPVSLLREIETTVIGWQLDLEAIILQIQALYQEGPIVDGWLESHATDAPPVPPTRNTTLRHADLEHLMEYVEEICKAPAAPLETPADGARTGYRLCGLDADGHLWSRVCPSPQVPYVSLAIARYQKLRTLLAQKQALEHRLNDLVAALTVLHGRIAGN